MTLHFACCLRRLVSRPWSLVLILLLASEASGQFTTVINVPPDEAPLLIGSDTQVNVFEGGAFPRHSQVGESDGSSTNVEFNILGGSIGRDFKANGGSTINIGGGTVGESFRALSGSTVNMTGGSLDKYAGVYNGSVVNISGGSVGHFFDAFNDSEVNISGGAVGLYFAAKWGSMVTLSGGSVDDGFRANWGSTVTLSGGEFRVNGALVEGLGSEGNTVTLNLPSGALLSGTFADGTPFAFSSSVGDTFAGGTLNLRVAALPPVGPASIVAPTDPVPSGIRQGQTLRVDAYGVVSDNFSAGLGSAVNIEPGGSVGDNLEAVGAEIRITGGWIGDGFDAFRGSVVTITGGWIGSGSSANDGSMVSLSGGSLGGGFDANRGSTVNVTGGSVRSGFDANRGSEVTISGGTVGSRFEANVGSKVTISGGTFGTYFSANSGSDVMISGGAFDQGFDANSGSAVAISGGLFGPNFDARSGSTMILSGGDFRLNGLPVDGLEREGDSVSLDVPVGALLSGEFADGTPFAFVSTDNDSFASGVLTLQTVALPPIGPAIITASSDPLPLGIRQGQRLRVDGGGVVPENFIAGRGSAVTVEPEGIVGDGFEAVGAEVDVSGGTVGEAFDAFDGSTVNVFGGAIGNRFDAESGSTINVFDGSIGDLFNARDGSTVNLMGGSIGRVFEAYDGSKVTISGGTIGERFRALAGSQIEVLGREFFLDGVPMDELANPGDSLVLETRDGARLTGTLLDGTSFAFGLHTLFSPADYFHPDATLRLTRVPEPSVWALACMACLAYLLQRR